MPLARVFVARFFQLVTERRFAEAERVLERIRVKVQGTEWNKGYFQALNGILLAQKSNEDQYAFLPNLDLTNEEELKKYRREFLKQVKDRIHADYDRGFFSAWADYMRVSRKAKGNAESAKQPAESEKTAEKIRESNVARDREIDDEIDVSDEISQ